MLFRLSILYINCACVLVGDPRGVGFHQRIRSQPTVHSLVQMNPVLAQRAVELLGRVELAHWPRPMAPKHHHSAFTR